MKPIRTIPVVLSLLLSGGLATAMEMDGMQHGAAVQTPMAHGMAMENDRPEWGNRQDVGFLSGMIAHHEGALDMAKAVVNATRDASVRKWAEGILSGQKKEIEYMQSLLRDMGMDDPDAAREMREEMKAMLAMPVSGDADVNFVAMMVPHHAGAIEMSLPVLLYSKNPMIRKLAEDIIIAQTKEVAEFRDWLSMMGKK